MSLIKRLFLPFLALFLLASGASPALAKKTPKKKSAPAASRSPKVHPLIARLTALPSGNGLLVGEPVAAGVDDKLAAFGAACGRWLHLVAAGQPELGKTAFWDSVNHGRRKLGRMNVRLELDDAVRIKQTLGITHAAVGRISGDAGSCTLSYQLYDLRTKKQLGESFTASGTEQQILDALPSLATQMARGLGVVSPRVPDGVGEDPPVMEVLGTLPWLPGEELSAEAQQSLGGLASTGLVTGAKPWSRAPLLAMYLYLINRGEIEDGAEIHRFGDALLARMPENALVRAEYAAAAAAADEAQGKRLPLAETTSLLKRYPHNYLLRVARAVTFRKLGRLREGRGDAELSVRCSPGNPHAWIGLGGSIGAQAQAIRRSRFVNDMTEAELRQVGRLYEEELPIFAQAVKLDPNYARAWNSLSSAAAFLGAGEVAVGAFERAYALDSTSHDVLWWGIQLYQPKWYGNPKRLEALGNAAVKVGADWPWAQRLELAMPLYVAGLPNIAEQLVKTDEERKTFYEHVQRHAEHRR